LRSIFPSSNVHAISAIDGIGTESLVKELSSFLPESPPLYSSDALSDRPMRFFASEIIRGKLFTNTNKEIPYSSEVIMNSFHEKKNIIVLSATIIVMRESQKGIVIGKGGVMIKQIGCEAREELERFFGKRIHLDMNVDFKKDWRKNSTKLKEYGYFN